MATTPDKLTALEGKAEISKAVTLWEQKFAKNANPVEGLGGTVWYHEGLGLWGHFGRTRLGSGGNYWNPFGRDARSFRSNMVVEINPPGAGIKPGVQGVIARDSSGARWLLHQGRLHPASHRITEAEFDAVAGGQRATVAFSDGTSADYHPIANLESPPELVTKQTADFVALCSRVRNHYVVGPEGAANDKLISDIIMGESSPERDGQYHIGAMPERIATKWHARVWNALVKELNSAGVAWRNGRLGKLGPDLVVESHRLLFELKVSADATSVQTAVGQLYLYATLLPHPFMRVFVSPPVSNDSLKKALKTLGIRHLTFTVSGNAIHFDHKHLLALLAEAAVSPS